MINLIPHYAKKRLLTEYWVRVFSVWLTLWAAALLCGACLLFPTYVLISSQVSVYETSAAEVSEKVSEYKNVSQALVEASQQATVVINETQTDSVSMYIELFERLQGLNITITDLSINRTIDNQIAPVQLTGVAIDRQALASFRDRLLEQEMIKEVDLPISNLASDKDIQFSITVTFINEIAV